MLTLRQYLDQFTRKEHTAELRRLMGAIGCTREHLYAMAGGKAASLDKALRVYTATHGRVDPRPLAFNFDWGMLDGYYLREHATPPPPTLPAAVARAGRSGVAGKARTGVQRAGHKAKPAGAGKASRKGSARTVK